MHVYYNGIVIKNCLTPLAREEVVYDSSGVNVIGHKYIFTFEFLVSEIDSSQSQTANVIPVWCDNGPYYTASIDQRVNYLRRKLNEPRKPFVVYTYNILKKKGRASVVSFPYGLDDNRTSAVPALVGDPNNVELKELNTIVNESVSKRRWCFDTANGPLPHSIDVIEQMDSIVKMRFTIQTVKIDCFRGQDFTYGSGQRK